MITYFLLVSTLDTTAESSIKNFSEAAIDMPEGSVVSSEGLSGEDSFPNHVCYNGLSYLHIVGLKVAYCSLLAAD